MSNWIIEDYGAMVFNLTWLFLVGYLVYTSIRKTEVNYKIIYPCIVIMGISFMVVAKDFGRFRNDIGYLLSELTQTIKGLI